jgi:uncharacterized membrane protein YhaH (DUF805 family)
MGWVDEFIDMFNKPFSFKGRIRCLEYNLSIPIVIIVATLGVFIWGSRHDITAIPGPLLVMAAVWFELAQKAKRFHDLGHPTWCLINFFAYSKLTGESGQVGENKYGPDPKPAKIDQ